MSKSQQFPTFKIKATEVAETIRTHLKAELNAYEELKKVENPTFSSLELVEKTSRNFSLYTSELSHFLSVNDKTNEFMDAYSSMIPELSEHSAKISQDPELYTFFKKIAETDLTPVERRVIDSELLAFKNAGIDLNKEDQSKLLEINKELSALSTKFGSNGTQDADRMVIDLVDDLRLDGVNEIDKARFEDQAVETEGVKYQIRTNGPDFSAIMSYAMDEALRKEVFMNYNTVAAPREGIDNEFDNTEIMARTLVLRQEKAKLLGYENFAELSLSKKMAETPDQVVDFLQDLTTKAVPQYKEERVSIKEYALENGYIESMEEDLKPWDASMILRKMKEEKFQINNQKVREYFPMEKVQQGLFWTIKELFGYDLKKVDFTFDKYVEDLELFEIKKDGKLIAYIYGDFFAYEGKRGGAWMSDYTERTEYVVPVAFVTCNFPRPQKGKESLLSFDEVVTLFHEFGHALHHTLTTVETSGAEGISGVPWDAVELPSTFMEFFCSKPEVLAQISGHYETGELLPQSMVDSLISSEHFLAASGLLRQMEFSLADMLVHRDGLTDIAQVARDFNEVNGMKQAHKGTAFYNHFGHIFAGGYAAGYYSYKWADILASDIFETFEDNGVICRETGERYLTLILSQGSSKEIMDMFRDFKGKEPNTTPFLKYTGIKVAA